MRDLASAIGNLIHQMGGIHIQLQDDFHKKSTIVYKNGNVSANTDSLNYLNSLYNVYKMIRL